MYWVPHKQQITIHNLVKIVLKIIKIKVIVAKSQQICQRSLPIMLLKFKIKQNIFKQEDKWLITLYKISNMMTSQISSPDQ